MSPIYVRPEREQAEHDRLIRFLQASYSQKLEAGANPGDERVAPLKIGAVVHFPDLVLTDQDRLAGVVEIETAASVNNLEAMAKWVPFSRARVPFHLYVPVQGYEATMRLVEALKVKAAEIWTYRPATDGFDLVRMHFDAALQNVKLPKIKKVVMKPAPAPQPEEAAAAAPPVETPAEPKPRAVKVRPAKAAKPAPKKKPAAKAAPAGRKPAAASRKAAKPSKTAKAVKSVKKATKVSKATKTSSKKARPKPAARKAPAARKTAKVVKQARAVRARPSKSAAKGAKKGAAARKRR